MNWFLFAIGGYFLHAVVGVIDKFLLGQRPVTKPPVYTFYIGLLSIFALVLAPFGLSWPGLTQFFVALIAGVLFLLGLLYLFEALDINEASRVFPVVGGLTPILILILSFIFLGERLKWLQIISFFLLVLGSVLITSKIGKEKKNLVRGVGFISLAILLGGGSLVLTKYVYINQGFISGFIWTRVGSFLTAVLFLTLPNLRQSIFEAGRQTKSGLSLLLVSGKAIAGGASVLINFAISLGSVSLVNASQGIQYTFLLILAVILSKKFPQVLEEKISQWILLQKILAILLIGIGLVILAI